MKSAISQTVSNWVEEESHQKTLAPKVIRKNDPWQNMSEEEIEDRRELIRYYINKEFELLLLIPIQPRENDFWFSSYEEFQQSPFNTWDFQRDRKPFNKYGYRIKKILERVKDLAIRYSCLTSAEGREDTLRKYENLVSDEFRDKLMNLVDKYRILEDRDEKMLLKAKIAKESRHIMKCKEVWQKYSTWE